MISAVVVQVQHPVEVGESRVVERMDVGDATADGTVLDVFHVISFFC